MLPAHCYEFVSIADDISSLECRASSAQRQLDELIEEQSDCEVKRLLELEAKLFRKLVSTLSVLSNRFNETLESGQSQSFPLELTDTEIARLYCLNRRLAELEDHLEQEVDQVRQALVARVNNDSDRMGDFEIEAALTYLLREDDPKYLEDKDNILSTRTVWLTSQYRIPDVRDWCDFPLGYLPELRKEPHCWLFHDLYDHSYGLAERRLGLQECARIGEIWVDISIEQQYFIDIESGQWKKIDARRHSILKIQPEFGIQKG